MFFRFVNVSLTTNTSNIQRNTEPSLLIAKVTQRPGRMQKIFGKTETKIIQIFYNDVLKNIFFYLTFLFTRYFHSSDTSSDVFISVYGVVSKCIFIEIIGMHDSRISRTGFQAAAQTVRPYDNQIKNGAGK